MKNLPRLLLVAMFWLTSGILRGDEPLAETMPSDDLSSTFLAKYQKQGDKEVVAVRIPKWKVEVAERTREVTINVPETRTRTVKNKEGRDELQVYMVNVPVKQRITENYQKRSPLAPLKGEIPFAEIKAWNIKGKPISSEELKAVLTKPTYLFGLTEEPKANVPPIDPFYATALRSDIIFVHSPKLNELYEQTFVFLEDTEDRPITVPLPTTDDNPNQNR